jgi:thiamine-monophosphate kinase
METLAEFVWGRVCASSRTALPNFLEPVHDQAVFALPCHVMPWPEKQLILQIRKAASSSARRGKSRSAIVKGIGDDCAVLRLPPGHETLVTTDFSLEGVHFRREWHPAETVGHRCLTRGLSDIAAMGGEPVAAFLSLALPPDLDQRWVNEFIKGFTALAKKHGVELAGGDTAQSPAAVLADVIVLGSVPRGKAVLRSGAKVGDDIYVTGKLGVGVAALNRLVAGEDVRKVQRDKSARKHFHPEPRIAIGKHLRERGLASAMIDISDGLSTDLAHICEESGVSTWIAEEAIPVAPGATLEDALHGGDEYELIFTARPQKHNAIPKALGGVPITWIGTITMNGEGPSTRRVSKRGVFSRLWMVNNERGRTELKPRGWEHFR